MEVSALLKRWRGTLLRGLFVATLTFSLAYALVVASAGRRFQRGESFVIPLVPGRSLIVDVWPVAVLADRFSPYSWSYSVSDVQTNSRWLGVWYQDNVARTRLRLAAVTLPTWPLTAATGVLWLTFGTLLLLPHVQRRSRHAANAPIRFVHKE